MMATSIQMKSAEILLVEDNPGDILFAKRALEKSKLSNLLIIAEDGEAALKQLQKSIPDLILLDLHLPGVSGQQILQTIKNDPRLCHIPVFIMTGSQSETEIMRLDNLPVSGYVTKPINLEKLSTALGGLENFYLTIAVKEG